MTTAAEGSTPAGLDLLGDADFVRREVWPLVARGESRPPSELTVAVHRSRADGRAVAAYTVDGSVRAFAKLYPDHAEGRRVHGIHARLCGHGFGPGADVRVPAPLAYLPEHGVLLLEPAGGECLAVTLERDWEAFTEGVAGAARWLAALHTSPARLGPREDVAFGASRLVGRAEKAAALRPDLEPLFRAAIEELRRRYRGGADPAPAVQTHGRFHGGHVFTADECVTAVDVDRAAVTDPAKDVGEFVAGLSAMRARADVGERKADAACQQFLEEYARNTASGLRELAYHWSYCVVWALVRQAFKDRPERRHWRERLDFLREELDAVPRRSAAWALSPRSGAGSAPGGRARS